LEVKVEKLYSGRKTSGFKVAPSGAPPFFLKVFHHPLNFKGALSALFLSSRPEREFKNSLTLLKEGFPVPKVTAFHSRKLLGLIPVNIGYTKAVYMEGLTPLDRLVGRKEFSLSFKEAVLLLARLHRKGFIHKDASLSNFALYKGRIFLIDLEGVSRTRLPFKKVKNLLRFLNDALKHGVEIEAESLTSLYAKEAQINWGRRRILSKVLDLIREKRS